MVSITSSDDTNRLAHSTGVEMSGDRFLASKIDQREILSVAAKQIMH